MKSEISILRKRVYAFTSDMGIVVCANYFLVASFKQFVHTVFFHLPIKSQLFLFHKMSFMSSISLMCMTFTYFSLFYFMTNGRTMGKNFFGLQVKNTNGEELSLQQAMLRSMAYFTCAMTGSFLFALSYIRKDQKSLADVFSGTMVGLDTPDAKTQGTEFQLVLLKETYEEDHKEEQIQDDKAA